jgi:hypothetical protein
VDTLFKRPKISRPLLTGGLIIFSAAFAWGQGLQNSGLQYLQTIGIPGWRATGAAGNANVDLMGYNPVTRMMYLADRTNNGIDVIDTHTNVVVGLIKMPPTSVQTVPATGPNGVWVAVNLQQLIVTDGLQAVYVWDLRAPQAQPDIYTFPTSMGTDTDGIAYDPINQTVYIVTDNPPEYLIGINLAYKRVVNQTPLPASADLIQFNPVDGKIYIAAEDAENTPANAAAGVYAYDPNSGNPGTVTLVTKVGPPCPGHGIDIDPVSNIAVVGCFLGAGDKGDIAVNLNTGALITTFTDVGGADAVVFNPNNRRFYIAATFTSVATSGCPKGSTGTSYPLLGVIDENGGNPVAHVACTGGGHIAGVDPISNFVYVPVSQYPADPTSATSGGNGVLVFRDNTPPAQAPVTQAQAALTAIAGSGVAVAGTVQFSVVGRRMHLTATASGLPASGQAAWLTVPTTITNEWLACAVNPSNNTAVCSEDLLGDPLLGAVVTLSVDSGSGGVPVARGTAH